MENECFDALLSTLSIVTPCLAPLGAKFQEMLMMVSQYVPSLKYNYLLFIIKSSQVSIRLVVTRFLFFQRATSQRTWTQDDIGQCPL